MQSLRYTESRPQPRLWDRRQGHLPGNLSCSDYTMCLASLWAILPFCSVKYKRRSGKGKRLGKVGSLAYQFTTFEFTEPGAGIFLYPGCEPSLGAWINREAEQEEGKTAVLKKGNRYDRNTSPLSFFFLPTFSSCPLRSLPDLKQYSVISTRPTGPGQTILLSNYAILYTTNCSWQLIGAEKFMSTQ